MKKILIGATLVLLVGVVTSLFFLIKNDRVGTTTPPPATHSPLISSTTEQCLGSNEEARYAITRNKKASDIGTVIIANRTDGKTTSSFEINDVIGGHYHGYEIHKCAVYALRQFNFNYQRQSAFPNYRVEVWRYGYNNISGKVSESTDFRVNSDESFIALRRGYMGSSDYALIIKNLNTLQDVYVLSVVDIAKQNPSIVANLQFEGTGWTKDSRYFWFSFGVGANVLGYVMVDSRDWSYKTFSAPSGTMGGDALNLEKGLITYSRNVAPWTGVEELDQRYRDEATRIGQITSFQIYNLFTKESRLLATTSDPTYYFRPRWLSDVELQYTLPSGATTTYITPL